jgi:cbb3-type cytochrome c oxidase subunit III
MVQYRLNLFLLVLVVAIAAAGWALERDLSQPNYESIVEGQMARSPAYDSFAPNPNFPDGLTSRQPPAGTVVRGQRPLYYATSPEDAVRAGLELHNPFPETDDVRLLRGSVVFANFCRVCHGPLGLGAGPVTQGGFPPPPSLLTDRSLKMPDGQMFHILTYGQGNMPATAAQLSPEDRWSAILHVRYLQKAQAPYRSPVPVTLQSIAGVFKQNCSACHGEDGTGSIIRKALPNIPDFTNLAWQVAQTEMAIVNQIDYGSQPLMPSFRYKLNRDEIQGLAVYVRSFPGRQVGLPTQPLVTSHMSPVNVYQNLCFACHDKTGHGDPQMRNSMPEIPDFTSPTWQKTRSDQDLIHSIMEGKGKFMLSMKDKLGTVDAKDMVALVRAFPKGQIIEPAPAKAPGPPAPEKAIRTADVPKLPPEDPFAKRQPPPAPSGELAARIRTGAAIFQQFCIVCHGPDGTGKLMRASMPAIPDFTDSAWQQQKENAELQASILNGKGTLMPANSGRVTADQTRDLVAYIRAFGPSTLTAVPVTDSQFDRSFRQLQQQWDELERELQKIKSQSK